ncbi:unnamed protein product [Oppiella nova]|uniref:Cytochrome P450 n=1 Tax=Oppiella nova TaxID=334625 RepID=A0A7R9LYM8_9ACAR|nr:unnamed protein product [Oppiella nova]CAG2168246.1 unnamed protein product [Oppiella nova]
MLFHDDFNILMNDTQGPNKKFVNKRLTESEMIANAFGFLLAGHQTTCFALSYCLHELALNPSVQQRLYDEINGATDSDGQIPYDSVLARLPYLDAVLSETLRRHFAVSPISRVAAIDYTLGDTGITIKAGQQIEIPVYSIHNSDKYFVDPFRFNPDRFLPHNRRNIRPYTLLSFSSGPRNCVGERFAMLTIKMTLAHMIRKYRFNICTETDDPIRYQKFTHFMLPERLIVRIEPRV